MLLFVQIMLLFIIIKICYYIIRNMYIYKLLYFYLDFLFSLVAFLSIWVALFLLVIFFLLAFLFFYMRCCLFPYSVIQDETDFMDLELKGINRWINVQDDMHGLFLLFQIPYQNRQDFQECAILKT